MTLLTRLHAYRATEQRSPTEDFLSEAFTEWLRLAGNAGLMSKVLRELLKLPEDQCLVDGDDGRNIRWHTQHIIGPGYRGSGKRPDIVGQSDNFFLIIENKIGAGFTQYEDADGTVGQLELYADYQKSQGKPHGGIVLLTQFTSAPAEWNKEKNRVVITWSEVHRWLSDRVSQDTPAPSNTQAILIYWTQNLINFLEDNEMTGIKIALSDIIAKPSYDRLCTGMDNLGAIARKELDGYCSNGGKWRNCAVPHGNARDEFNPPQFFGVPMTPEGKHADGNFILWSGVLAADAYDVSPHVKGIPELSVGFGVWPHRFLNDPECIALEKTLKEQLAAIAPNMDWGIEWREVKGHPQIGALIAQARLSLIELHRLADDGFWDESAREFFRTACGVLCEKLPEKIWEDIEKILRQIPNKG